MRIIEFWVGCDDLLLIFGWKKMQSVKHAVSVSIFFVLYLSQPHPFCVALHYDVVSGKKKVMLVPESQ
jgi:hypothetical protein